MKLKLVILPLVVFSFIKVNAQKTDSAYVRKNEIGIDITTLLMPLFLGDNVDIIRSELIYKRKLKKDYHARIGIGVRNTDDRSNALIYSFPDHYFDQQITIVNPNQYFKYSYDFQESSFYMSLGVEKRKAFKKAKTLSFFYGVDLSIGNLKSETNINKYLFTDSASSLSHFDLIDVLGDVRSKKTNAILFRTTVFTGLIIDLSKHFALSGQFNLSYSLYRAKMQVLNYEGNEFDVTLTTYFKSNDNGNMSLFYKF